VPFPRQRQRQNIRNQAVELWIFSSAFESWKRVCWFQHLVAGSSQCVLCFLPTSVGWLIIWLAQPFRSSSAAIHLRVMGGSFLPFAGNRHPAADQN
jgi:hypothetical protein